MIKRHLQKNENNGRFEEKGWAEPWLPWTMSQEISDMKG